MKSSESVKELSSSLVRAQSEIKNLYPSSKGYGYDYVPLNDIIDMLKSVLPKYGLAYLQLPYGGQSGATVGLTTRIIHESGEWVEETAEFPVTDMKGVNATQKAGAAITYFRRYALLSAFGITGDKDIDANDKAFDTKPTTNAQPPQNPSARRQPKFPKTEQANKLKSAVLDYINIGVIADKQTLDYANQYMFDNDVGNMNALLDWCKQQKTA